MPREKSKTMEQPVLQLKIVCTDLPGLRYSGLPDEYSVLKEPVYLGIQKGQAVIEQVPADRRQVTFKPAFRVGTQKDGSPNFLGPYAQGPPADRFFYLSWGIKQKDGEFCMFRRLKIWLTHLTWAQVNASIESGAPIVARLRLKDGKGEPLCGGPGENIRWE